MKINLKIEKKKHQGSILVFSLLIMFIVLSVVVGISGTSVISRKTSSSTDDSVRAFQAADSGLEKVLAKIKMDNLGTVDELRTTGLMSCNVVGGLAVIADNNVGYELTFKDDSDNVITTCNSANAIGEVKSIGSYETVSRAIEISVDIFDPCDNVLSVDYYGDGTDVYDTVAIGDQCWLDRNLNVGNILAGANSLPNPADAIIEKWCPGASGTQDTNMDCDTYGGLYRRDEAMSIGVNPNQGICPNDWHIPSDDEWHILENSLKLVAASCNLSRNGSSPGGGWDCNDAGIELKVGGISEFNALFSGQVATNKFWFRGIYGYFWSSSNNIRAVKDDADNVFRDDNLTAGGIDFLNNRGASVRCIKD
ncbi:MAG: TIR protein [uncultured bacterium]|nr:MAG: TIR protein [uncultured bacterium]HBR71651.1 hypothetical protein [Candidatus Moranbacteria bacterium]